MQTLNYIAYGSNLHPLRLNQRVPSAELRGVIAISGYTLRFHKRHADRSAKANMYFTGNSKDEIYTALYELAAHEKIFLDQAEGEGYRCDNMCITFTGQELNCFVYIAEASHIDDSLVAHEWYKSIVHAGAKYLEFPQRYISQIDQVVARPDPDQQRNKIHQQLLAAMLAYK